MERLKHHFNRFESIARDSCIPFSGLGARECKKADFLPSRVIEHSNAAQGFNSSPEIRVP